MKCDTCGSTSNIEVGEAFAMICFDCRVKSRVNSRENSLEKEAQHLEAKPEAKSESKTKPPYDSPYPFAKFVAHFLSIVGWFTVLLGGLGLLGGLSGRYLNINGTDFNITLLVPGAITILAGFFLIALALIAKATLDNAELSKAILNYLNNDG